VVAVVVVKADEVAPVEGDDGSLLGDRKASLGKFAVVKDIVREQPRGRLESILHHVKPELMFSAFPSDS